MGILSHLQNSVTLVNRTKGAGKYERDLQVRFDGEDLVLKPGRNYGIPRVCVYYALAQNILMGSRHPSDPTQFISLVGIEKDPSDVLDWAAFLGIQSCLDCTPIPEESMEVASRKIEAIDRTGEFWGEEMGGPKRVLGRKTGYSPHEAKVPVGTFQSTSLVSD